MLIFMGLDGMCEWKWANLLDVGLYSTLDGYRLRPLYRTIHKVVYEKILFLFAGMGGFLISLATSPGSSFSPVFGRSFSKFRCSAAPTCFLREICSTTHVRTILVVTSRCYCIVVELCSDWSVSQIWF